MALELEGKAFGLDKTTLKKYSKRMIFRVGMQHIRTNRDPELPPIEISPIHIDTRYRHHKMESGTKIPKGELVFFETSRYNPEFKTKEYTPARISIGNKGYIESIDPEMNFFLDNHPSNEMVKADPAHPNHINGVTTYFATYHKERSRDALTHKIELAGKLSLMILDPQEFDFDRLKGIALLVVKGSQDYNLAHKLNGLEAMDHKDLRAELARLCTVNPVSMKTIIENDQLDYLEWINKFIELKILSFVNGEWVPSINGVAQAPIMRVMEGHDGIHSLADFFKNTDRLSSNFKMLRKIYSDVETMRTQKS